jgi:hypothetical protein
MSSLDSLFAVGDIWVGQEAAAAAIGEVRFPFITCSRVGPVWFLYVRAIEAWAALRLEYFILERRTFLPKNCQTCSGSLSRTARPRCCGLPRPSCVAGYFCAQNPGNTNTEQKVSSDSKAYFMVFSLQFVRNVSSQRALAK